MEANRSNAETLVKAGALIIAEIERIDRAAGIGVKGSEMALTKNNAQSYA